MVLVNHVARNDKKSKEKRNFKGNFGFKTVEFPACSIRAGLRLSASLLTLLSLLRPPAISWAVTPALCQVAFCVTWGSRN